MFRADPWSYFEADRRFLSFRQRWFVPFLTSEASVGGSRASINGLEFVYRCRLLSVLFFVCSFQVRVHLRSLSSFKWMAFPHLFQAFVTIVFKKTTTISSFFPCCLPPNPRFSKKDPSKVTSNHDMKHVFCFRKSETKNGFENENKRFKCSADILHKEAM